MATESAAAVADAPPAATETAAKLPHKLERKWAFWCDNHSKPKQQGAAWGSSLRKLYTFDTVEEFWSLYDQIFRPSKIVVNADFHLFKAGIEPKWEDPECTGGGKWTVTSNRKTNLDNMWLETLMALIGEQFDEADEICGVVASVRQKQDKISLWTKTATNEAAQTLNIPPSVSLEFVDCVCTLRRNNNAGLVSVIQMSIGRKWKEVLDITDKIFYSFHDDSKRERSAKNRYNV